MPPSGRGGVIYTIKGAGFSTLSKETVENVVVTQTGCMGICQYEPIVEVFVPGKEKVTYVKVTPEKARRIVKEHVAGGTPVTEYTIGANA